MSIRNKTPSICLVVMLASSTWNLIAEHSRLVEPALPKEITTAEATGFFPTQAEFPLLRGAADSRSLGVGWDSLGPDVRMQTASGIFPYAEPAPNFYQRNPALFRNMDHLLGVFTPNDAWTVEGLEDRGLRNTALTFDANLGLLTRTFSPDLAMVKAGPLYFDLLWIGAGAVWSDYNGVQLGPNNNDGMIGYIDVGLRGLLRLTDTIYLSVAGQLMYLPSINEFAFTLGAGNQSALAVDLFYGDTLGEWDVSFTSQFFGRPGLNFFANTTDAGADRAGRYWFGIQQARANQFRNFEDENAAFFGNLLALSASRLVFDNQWRFWSIIRHTDFWRGFDFDNHGKREQLSLILGYEGSTIPFAPRISYDLWSFDGYESLWHQFMLQFTGRLTENINWIGSTGYLFGTGNSTNTGRYLWNMQFAHTLTARTNHTLSFGENFFTNDIADDALTSRYISYGINHHFARNLSLSLFAQVSDRENHIAGGNRAGNTSERAGGGATLTYQPLDFTSITASVLHDRSLQPVDLYDRWVSRISINQQLSLRLTGHVFYMYEESNGRQRPFTEHAIGASLRRFF